MAAADRFELAAQRIRDNKGLSLTNEHKLQLYGYYKQATEGPCCISKPGIFDFTGRAKWEAWHQLADMSQDTAQQKYIALVDTVDPHWDTKSLDTKDMGVADEGKGHSTGGPVVSRLLGQDDNVPDCDKTLFDWCKEGNLDKVKACLDQGENVNTHCDQGMALLHWACDRGNLDMVTLLVSHHNADVNTQDGDGQTPLHYASSCGHELVLQYLLMHNGVDASIKDNDGCTARDVCEPSVAHVFNV